MKENNILLAEFLGAKIEDNRIISEDIVPLFISANSFTFCLEDDEEGYNILDTINFDTSWDWLMLVVDKIESLGFETSLTNKTFFIRIGGNNTQAGIMYTNKIEAVYNSCIEFIKWYNK